MSAVEKIENPFSEYFKINSDPLSVYSEKHIQFIKMISEILRVHAFSVEENDTVLFHAPFGPVDATYSLALIQSNRIHHISFYFVISDNQIEFGWGQVPGNYTPDGDFNLDEWHIRYIDADFKQAEDNSWLEHALMHFEKELNRTIYLFVTFIDNKAVKLSYKLKDKNDKWVEIGDERIGEYRFRNLFRPKVVKTVTTTLLEHKTVNDLIATLYKLKQN